MMATALPNWVQAHKNHQQSAEIALFASYQKAHWEAFLAQGWPTRQDERWKYADLSFLLHQDFIPAPQGQDERLQAFIEERRSLIGDAFLLVFINGFFSKSHSDLSRLPSSLELGSMAEALHRHTDKVSAYLLAKEKLQGYPFAQLNASLFHDGSFLFLAEDCKLSQPVHVLSIAVGEMPFAAHPHHMLIMGKRSRLVLIEEHVSLSEQPYLMNSMNSWHLDADAEFDYYKIQDESKQASHIAATFLNQKQNSQARLTYFSFDHAFSRDDVVVTLQEEGASCQTAGFYQLSADDQYRHHHIDIRHAAPRSRSGMLFKGILDKKSTAIFHGKIYVDHAAQAICAYQGSHHLLLSDQSAVRTRPELEIYADDVQCKHGATTAQLDADALFYLRSRGIPRDAAVKILLHGFAEEVIQSVACAAVKTRLRNRVFQHDYDDTTV